ncbi:MAG: hypothetical protein ACLRVT_09145 [Oscillospiraceae bacterium]
MRTLTHLDEFRREAQNALFTKQQAISVTLRLLELEKNSQENTDQESAILLWWRNAISIRPRRRQTGCSRMRCRPYYRAGYHQANARF